MDNSARTVQSWFKSGYKFFSGPHSRKGIVSLSDQAVVSATNFFTGVILARVCSKEEFGLYMLGFTLILLIISVQESIVSIPYTVYSPRLSGDELMRYTGSTLVHHAGLSMFDMVCLFAVGLILSYGIGPEGLAPVILTLSAVIPFLLLREYLRRIFFAGMKMKKALLMDLLVGVVQIGLLLLLAHFGMLSLVIVYCVIGLTCALVSLSWVAWFRKSFVFVRRRFTDDLKQNWGFGRWHLSSTMVYWAGSRTFPWFLAAFYGTKETGVLAACMGISALANPILIGMINFMNPRTAHALNKLGVDEMIRIVLKALFVISIFMAAFNIGVFIFGEELVVLAYGEKYAGTGLIVSMLIVGLSIDALVIPVNCALYAMDRPDVGFRSRLIALGVTLTLGLWLVSSFGIIGAAMGLIAVNLAAASYEAGIFIREIRSLRGDKV